MTLKTITNTELEAILDKHKKWLNGDADGERGDPERIRPEMEKPERQKPARERPAQTRL